MRLQRKWGLPRKTGKQPNLPHPRKTCFHCSFINRQRLCWLICVKWDNIWYFWPFLEGGKKLTCHSEWTCFKCDLRRVCANVANVYQNIGTIEFLPTGLRLLLHIWRQYIVWKRERWLSGIVHRPKFINVSIFKKSSNPLGFGFGCCWSLGERQQCE